MPIFKIPKKGDTLILTDNNFDFYKPLIEKNEGVQAGRILNKIFINNSESYTYTFKYNYYFLQGDNTEGSQDSRHFGLIGENQLKGKVVF
jgi:signal peptidase I